MPVMRFADLLQFETDQFRQDHRALRRVENSLRPLPTFLVRWCASRLASFLDTRTQRMAAAAYTFRGMALEIERQGLNDLVDSDDNLRTKLDRMEADLVEIAGECGELVAGLRANDGKSRGVFRNAIERVGIAAGELRQEVRYLKGVIQAHDASVYATRHAQRAATTLDELESQLQQFVA